METSKSTSKRSEMHLAFLINVIISRIFQIKQE